MTPTAAALVVVGVCLIVAFFCWKLHRYATRAAILCECIARMLRCSHVSEAEMIARRTMQQLQEMNLWKD